MNKLAQHDIIIILTLIQCYHSLWSVSHEHNEKTVAESEVKLVVPVD